MTFAAEIFNPKYLKGKLESEMVTVIHYKDDKLPHFNYHNFTSEFIRWLENELLSWSLNSIVITALINLQLQINFKLGYRK